MTKRSVTVIKNTFIILIIVIGLISLSELFIRTFFPQNASTSYYNNLSLGMKDEILGHLNRPNAIAKIKNPEFSAEYTINGNGFRDKKLHLNPKPKEFTRILILGDSFTFGAGTNYEKIWPVLFEEKISKEINNIDIIKAGVSGYDTRQEFLYLERLFPFYKPDIVVIVFLPNDLFTNSPIDSSNVRDEAVISLIEQKKPSLLHSLTLSKRLLLLSDRLYFNIYLKTSRAQYYASEMNDQAKKQIHITKEILLKANNYCKQNNATLIVLSMPQLFQVIAKANDYKANNIDVDNIDRLFSKSAEENGFYWITTLSELAQNYRKNRQDLYYRYDGHLNDLGNHEIGDIFTSKVIKLLKKQF